MEKLKSLFESCFEPTRVPSSMVINLNNNAVSSSTDIQTSSGEELSVKRISCINNIFKESKEIQLENTQKFKKSPTKYSLKSKEDKSENKNHIYFDKGGTFTFNTSDNNNNISIQSDSNLNSILNLNTVIQEDEIKNNMKLVLKEISGGLFNGKDINIDASGVVNGLRGKKDGVSYFGTVENINGNIINDYVINYNDEKSLRLFYIMFQSTTKKYYIKNINSTKKDKNFLYTKILNSFSITTKKFFSFEDCMFFIEPLKDQRVYIEMCFKKSPTLNFYFNGEDSPIKIGKSKDCRIRLDSELYNDVQCTLNFDQVLEQWSLEDGYQGQKSKSGTWLLVDNKFEITQNSIFKVSKYLFKILISK